VNHRAWKELLAGALCLACGGTVGAEEPVVATVEGQFFEVERADVDVGGSVIVGVADPHAATGRAVRKLLLAGVSGASSGRVCLVVLSRDGVYYSRNTYRYEMREGSERPTVALPYDQSKLHNTLEQYGEGELAIRVTPGPCDDPATGYLVVGSTAAAAAKSVRVFVNSFGATDVFFEFPQASLSGACTGITEGRRTSFDFWCDIPRPAVSETSPSTSLEVRILRERYGREMPEAPVTLLLAIGPYQAPLP
jgi:hypothetical protein